MNIFKKFNALADSQKIPFYMQESFDLGGIKYSKNAYRVKLSTPAKCRTYNFLAVSGRLIYAIAGFLIVMGGLISPDIKLLGRLFVIVVSLLFWQRLYFTLPAYLYARTITKSVKNSNKA